MKTSFLSVVLVSSLLLLCGCGGVQGAGVVNVKVGGFFYSSTSSDAAGLSRLAGFMAAIDQINANPRYNNTIVLNTTNYFTARNAVTAGAETLQAVAAGANVLVTTVTTPEQLNISSLAPNTPQVSSGANVPLLSSPTTYPFFVRNIPSGTDQTACLASVINTHASTLKVATVYTSDDPSTNAIAASLLNKTSSTSFAVSTGVPNAAAAASFLAASGARIFPIISQSNDISKIAAALNSSGLDPRNFIVAGPDSMFSSTLFASPGSQSVLQNAFACVFAPISGTQYYAFLAAYAPVATRMGATATPDSKAANTYDLAYIIAEAALAVVNAGGDVSNAATFMAAIRAVNFVGASGQQSFNAGSNDIAEVKAYVVRRVLGTTYSDTVGVYGVNRTLVLTNPNIFPPSPTPTTSAPTSAASSLLLSAQVLVSASLVLMLLL